MKMRMGNEDEDGVPCEAALLAVCHPRHHKLSPAAMSPTQRYQSHHQPRHVKSPCRGFPWAPGLKRNMWLGPPRSQTAPLLLGWWLWATQQQLHL